MNRKKLCNGNYAAIDIGSNAVRLLIKRISMGSEGLTITKEQLIRVPLRLGFDVFTKGKISKRKSKKLCRLVTAFSGMMKLYDVVDYQACATSAMRDASNGKKLISMLKKSTGVRIHLLSGQEEARLIYNTHAEFIDQQQEDFLYVDVGGGSTEINLIVDHTLVFSRSYNIGTIRVLSDTVDPEEWNRLKEDLKELDRTHSRISILGSGGNINKLYRLVGDRDRKHQRMTVESLAELHEKMSHMSLEDRVKTYSLKYDRADVIVPASHVFLTIAGILHSRYIYVPTVGLSDGMIDEIVYRKSRRKEVNSTENTFSDSGQTDESLGTSDKDCKSAIQNEKSEEVAAVNELPALQGKVSERPVSEE